MTCTLLKVFDFWVIGHCTLWGCGFHADWSVLIREALVFGAYVVSPDSISCVNGYRHADPCFDDELW